MNQKDDRVFIRRFSGIVIGLIIFTVIILVLAFSLRTEPDPTANPSQVRLAEERIAPVADVRVGTEGQTQLDAAEAAAVAAVPAVAAGGAVDGKQVYDTVCTACHALGVAGAPVPGSALMAERLQTKGVDGLVLSVINGLNVMPPRAGNPALTDVQIRAAVEFMIGQ